MINSQRKKAAQLGANGVVPGRMKDPSTRAQIAGGLIGWHLHRKGDALAIYIPSDTARVAAACRTAR